MVCRFIEASCVHGEGDWFGKPFVLRPWQKHLINLMFELVWDPQRAAWRRRYTRALVGLPSGSGKTELAAAIGHYFLVGGTHRSPLVAVAASSKEQAGLVFGAAKAMAEESRILKRYTEAGADSITLKGQPGRLYRVSAADGTNDGQRPSCCIFDELHEWPESKNTFQVLSKGTAKRVDSFQLYITTAGWDKETTCGRLYDHGKKLQRGELSDDSFFFYWREAPEDADADDEAVWRAAHPAAGDFMTIEALRQKRQEMPDAVFRRYFLNQWTEVQNAWLKGGQWQACQVADDEAEFKTEDGPVWVAWDAATEDDSTAIVAAQRYTAMVPNDDGVPVETERVRVQSRIWERPVNSQTGKPIEGWRLPIAECELVVRNLAREYTVEAIAFDPAFVTWSAAELEAEGLPMAKFPQSPSRMAEASQMLYQLIVRKRLAHNGDPGLARHVRNAVAEQLRSGSAAWRLAKGKAKRKMDGAVALAMVAWLIGKHEDQGIPDISAMLYTGAEDKNGRSDVAIPVR